MWRSSSVLFSIHGQKPQYGEGCLPFTAVLHPFTHRKALNQDDLKTANCILPVQSGDGSSQSREEFSISPSFDHTPRKERPRFSILSHIDHTNEANQHETPRPIQRASTNTTRQTLSRALKPPRRVHKSKEGPKDIRRFRTSMTSKPPNARS